MGKSTFLGLVFLAATLSVSAHTRVVPDDYDTIQQAIGDCNEGDTVLVEPGEYLENIDFLGKEITVTSTNPEDPDIVAGTIINGSGIGSVVTFANGEGRETVLTGFTITGGVGTDDNVIITEGSYLIWGAGICCINSSPTILKNVVTDNVGLYDMEGDDSEDWQLCYGGGICCVQSDAIIHRNTIKNNTAFAGGGIMSYYSDAIISHNLIYDNSACIGGGVIMFSGTLVNNTLTDNDASLSAENATSYAGNLYAVAYSGTDSTVVENNIICNAKSGDGVYTEDCVFLYNDVWGNLPNNYVDDEEEDDSGRRRGSQDELEGNLCQDPLLVDQCHISTDSPCWNAGDPNTVIYSWQYDIDGECPVMDVCIDMGADELTGNARPVAHAGVDQYYASLVGEITLDGTGSYDFDGEGALIYQWQQISGETVTLFRADTAEPSFSPLVEDVYYFELIVSDGSLNSNTATVMIVVGNRQPVADAGDDQSCEPGVQITLNALGSTDPDGDEILGYSWTQTFGPSAVLSDANTPCPMFTPMAEGEYTFELIVSDGQDASLPSTVTVECRIGSIPDDYGYRWIDNNSPWGPKFKWIDIQTTGTLIPGTDYSFEECFGPYSMGFDFDFYGQTYQQFYVQSNGLISFTADSVTYDNQPIPVADEYNNLIAMMWTYMYPESGSKIYVQNFDYYTVVQFVDYEIGWGGQINAQVIMYQSGIIVIQFQEVSEDAYLYEYTIGIENADGTVGTQVAYNDYSYLCNELAIEFSLGPPYQPVADAGPDQYLDAIEQVVLDGTGSSDRDPCDVLTYQWTQTEGPTVQLSDSTAAQPTFMPTVEGHYRFELVVSDGTQTSHPDEVLIVVGNSPPVADAGVNRVIQIPGQIVLDGSDSYDVDLNDELTFIWTQIEGPQVVLEDANTVTPTFYCDEGGLYLFELIVNDGLVDSDPSVVEVTTVTVTTSQQELDAGFDTSDYFHYPDISGNKVIYAVGSACDFTWNIRCKDLDTGDVTTYAAGGIDTQPKLDGEILVWFGGPNWGVPWYHEPSNTSVFAKNLTTGATKTLRRYSHSECYSHPVISGHKVVWLEHLGLDPDPEGSSEANYWWNTPYNVCGADITSIDDPVYFTIAEDVGTRDPYPCQSYGSDFDDVIDISGDMVVYEAGGDIYGADISDINNIAVFSICTHSARQYDPAISGHFVTWTDERNDSGDIYGADLSDINDIRVTPVIKASGIQQQSAIDEHVLVYVDGEEIKSCCVIRDSGILSIELSGGLYGMAPAIDGSNIVWQTESYGEVQGISLDFAYSTYDGPIQNLTSGKHYDYIQYAINDSQEGDVISVEPGTYYENINFLGKPVQVCSSEPNNPLVVKETVIIGDSTDSTVTFSAAEDANGILAGFTITGGQNGIYCDGSSPLIDRCVIEGCCENGIFLNNASQANISACTITCDQNGVYCYASSPVMSDCVMTGNGENGIYLYAESHATLSGCTITANTGSGIDMPALTGGRFKKYSYPDIANCIVAANGRYGISEGIPTVTHCTICDNLGSGLFNSDATLANSIVYFNGDGSFPHQINGDSVTIAYSNIQGLESVDGNLNVDPLFADRANGDYHLMSQTGRWDAVKQGWIQDSVSSPCIDAGDPNSDIGLEPEPNGARINMGAYGGTIQASRSSE